MKGGGDLATDRSSQLKILFGEVSAFSDKLRSVRPTLMGTENLYENGPNPFFFVFFNLMGTRMVKIRIAKSV